MVECVGLQEIMNVQCVHVGGLQGIIIVEYVGLQEIMIVRCEGALQENDFAMCIITL